MLSHIYLIFLVMLGWALFAISDLSTLGELFGRLFSLKGGIDWLYYLRDYAVMFLLCILASTPFFKFAAQTVGKNQGGSHRLFGQGYCWCPSPLWSIPPTAHFCTLTFKEDSR